MWSWLLTVGLLYAGCTAEEDPSCPDHCRCYWDQDNYRAAQCTPAATASHYTDAFPSVQVLNIKPLHKAIPIKLAPKMFQRFLNVKILNLSNGSISQVPNDVFHGLRYVSDIDLSYNRIRSINGIVFKNLIHLQTLLLRGNPLILNPFTSIISDTLKELDMGECGLKTIPDHTFSNVNRLTHLSLDGNQLQTIFYQSIPNNLRYLNLANNKITKVPTKVLLSLSFLRRIDLSGNPVNCTCALMIMQDWFSGKGIALENDLICDSPEAYHGKSLNKINENELCKYEMNKERQMNKLSVSYTPRDTYHIGSEFNSLPTYDVLMADEARGSDAEVLYTNDETRAMGTHMEQDNLSKDASKETMEQFEGSGSEGDFTIDSQESKHLTVDPDGSEESSRSLDYSSETNLHHTTSSAFDNTIAISENPSSQNVSSIEDENSSKNQSFEIDSSSEGEASSTHSDHGSSETMSEVTDRTVTEDAEGSGAGTFYSSETSSHINIIDDNESISSTTEAMLSVEVTDKSTTESVQEHFPVEVESSSATSVSEEPLTTEGAIETFIDEHHTSPTASVSSTETSSEFTSSKTTEGIIMEKEITEAPILRKKVVTDGSERYEDMSTEASIANGTGDIIVKADTGAAGQSVTTYIIVAVIALPVIVLILMAACRKKTPRKVRLPQDTESNLGTELQDMDTLLPKNGAENGVKVVPKANGAANPADSKSPEEVAPVLQADPEVEAEPPVDEPPPSRQNGATTPIQKTKAKLTTLPDSIPKTPVFIHTPYSE